MQTPVKVTAGHVGGEPTALESVRVLGERVAEAELGELRLGGDVADNGA